MLKDSILLLAGGLLAFVVLHGWVRDTFGPTPEELDAARRAWFSTPSVNAKRAVRLFDELPPLARRELRESLERTFIPLDDWIAELNQRGYVLLCLGEDHRDATREFLARELLPRVAADSLMLEATTDELHVIEAELAEGATRVPLLEADIAGVLRAARTHNHAVAVVGIEETDRQRVDRQRNDSQGFRDDSITRNFWRGFKPGQRHIVLFGALHCTKQQAWLFDQIERKAPPQPAGQMQAVRVVGAFQDRTIADLLFFLDHAGYAPRRFVIARPATLHPYLKRRLLQSISNRFDAVVVFRD